MSGQHAWDDVAAEVADVVAKAMAPTVRKASDDFYEGLMNTVQDYLADNITFNIASRLDAAERGRRSEWERAERAEKASAMLLTVLIGAANTFRRYEVAHNAKGTVEGAQKAAANKHMADQCVAAITLARGEQS